MLSFVIAAFLTVKYLRTIEELLNMTRLQYASVLGKQI